MTPLNVGLTVAAGALTALNVATVLAVRKWRNATKAQSGWIENAAQHIENLNEKAEAANTGEPQGSSGQGDRGQRQNPVGVAVIASRYELVRLWCERWGYDTRDVVPVTSVEHLRGRTYNRIVFLDFEWTARNDRARRGELAMAAETSMACRLGRPGSWYGGRDGGRTEVEYWNEIL